MNMKSMIAWSQLPTLAWHCSWHHGLWSVHLQPDGSCQVTLEYTLCNLCLCSLTVSSLEEDTGHDGHKEYHNALKLWSGMKNNQNKFPNNIINRYHRQLSLCNCCSSLTTSQEVFHSQFVPVSSPALPSSSALSVYNNITVIILELHCFVMPCSCFSFFCSFICYMLQILLILVNFY